MTERKPIQDVEDLLFATARRDMAMLRKLVADERLHANELDAFEDMLNFLESFPDRELTIKQRQWVYRRFDALELELDDDDPAMRNAGVPRGREVKPAQVLLNLPKKPPRRE